MRRWTGAASIAPLCGNDVSAAHCLQFLRRLTGSPRPGLGPRSVAAPQPVTQQQDSAGDNRDQHEHRIQRGDRDPAPAPSPAAANAQAASPSRGPTRRCSGV
jgi:hypothetical protein